MKEIECDKCKGKGYITLDLTDEDIGKSICGLCARKVDVYCERFENGKHYFHCFVCNETFEKPKYFEYIVKDIWIKCSKCGENRKKHAICSACVFKKKREIGEKEWMRKPNK